MKKRFYITLIIEVVLIGCRIGFKDYPEAVVTFNILIAGAASYLGLYYLFEKGVFKSSWTRQRNKIILYFTLIGVLIFGMYLSNRIDDDAESIWVINHNIWLADLLGGILLFLVFYLIFSWVFGHWERIETLKNEKSRAELALLKNQINPHFFFNTLNNLFSMIKKDQDKAQDYVLKLSDMMRFTIYDGAKELVSLDAEITYLTNFITLQVARYHKKIDIDFEHHVSKADQKVSPLLFIILLENAFKHGVEKLLDKAQVKMKLIEADNRVFFRIINNFDPEDHSSVEGIGLKNLQERLHLIYPNKHHLKIEKEHDQFTAELTLEL